ncbi:RimJ/RimL family protein N-acetyltransferase [Salirhabdus euzebyi]|uniref:RimJ/RimL family protein N-acetyltransferase n=1 Tax=Salirhabdus euzebyi TaxID=394506 RepID=A0A841Q298_9BACI|nr:GNAT family N-acetyltransferase [Salirhabdus euzebyi]MBB6452315.1 RimJ/RimL family protein N-acetyltransferase [Salirhabdus euzebyi]
MNWSIRELVIEDVPALLEWYNNEELHNTANAKEFKSYTLKQLNEYWKGKLARPNAKYFTIIVDEQVVGRVGLKQQKNKDIFEYSILIGVQKLYSKGLGTEVTKYFVEKVFLDPNISSVYLEVRADNRRAIRCYEKVGFQISKTFEENKVTMYGMDIKRIG